MTDKEYFAFISYQRSDENWAKWLEHELEHYHLPITLDGHDDLPKELRPIFRDNDELSAGNLPQQIQKALENSKHLIVICSPSSAKSSWVNKEIETFVGMGKTDKIFPFIIEGVAMCKDPEDPNECFPPALRNLPNNDERLGANVNEDGHVNKLRACVDCPIKEEHSNVNKQGDINDKGRDAAVVKIVAGMLDLNFDTLWQRYEREKAEEERRTKEQRDKLLCIQSRLLSKEAMECLVDHQFDTASLIALAALPSNLNNPDRPYVEEAEMALRKSTIDTSPIIRFPYYTSCISKKGDYYAVAGKGYTISLWNSLSNDCLKKYKLLDLAPDGLDSWQQKHGQFKIITFEESNSSCTLYFSSGNILYTLDCLSGQTSVVYKSNSDDITFIDTIFSPTQKLIICIAESIISTKKNHFTFLLDLDSKECIKEINFTTPTSISFSPNGDLIAFVGEGSIHIYDIAGDTYPNKLKRIDAYNGLFIDNNTFVFSCSDNTLWEWNIVSDEMERIYQCDSKITGIISEKELVAFSTAANDIIVFDINLRIRIARRNWHSKIALKSFSEDASTLTYTDNYSFRTWNFRINEFGSYLLYYHSSPISCDAYSTDHLYYVSASNESIKIWDIPQQRIKGEFSISSSVNQMVISSKYNRIVYDNYEGVWNLDYISGEHTKLAPSAANILLSPDDKFVLITYDKKTIYLFDIVSLDLYLTIKMPKDQILFGLGLEIVAFSPNGDYIATLTSPEDPDSMVATLWDVKSGVPLSSIIYESGYSESVSFTPCGEAVIIDNKLIWNYAKNQIKEIEQKPSSLLNNTNENIEYEGIYVVMKRTISLQELINQTRERFKEAPLTSEERKKYFLE